MATILENLRRRQGELAGDPNASLDNVRAAVAAMEQGISSTAWSKYMEQFASDTTGGAVDAVQLARLTATDGTAGDEVLARKRGYIVGNAMCGMTTNDTMDYAVESIDHGVKGEACEFENPCPTPGNDEALMIEERASQRN